MLGPPLPSEKGTGKTRRAGPGGAAVFVPPCKLSCNALLRRTLCFYGCLIKMYISSKTPLTRNLVQKKTPELRARRSSRARSCWPRKASTASSPASNPPRSFLVTKIEERKILTARRVGSNDYPLPVHAGLGKFDLGFIFEG